MKFILQYFRTYNQLWGQAQSVIQSVLTHESQAYLGKAEKVFFNQNYSFFVLISFFRADTRQFLCLSQNLTKMKFLVYFIIVS